MIVSLLKQQHLEKLLIGETPKEMLGCDLKLEQIAIPLLREAIEYCESIQDFISRASILESEEEHIDWLETQLELIEKVDEQNYLQPQM